MLMLDGENVAERCVVVALDVTADGTKKLLELVARLHGEQGVLHSPVC